MRPDIKLHVSGSPTALDPAEAGRRLLDRVYSHPDDLDELVAYRKRRLTAAGLWLCAGKCRSRYPLVTGLPRAQEYQHTVRYTEFGARASRTSGANHSRHFTKGADFPREFFAWLMFDSGRSMARRILAGCQTPSEAADEILSQRHLPPLGPEDPSTRSPSPPSSMAARARTRRGSTPASLARIMLRELGRVLVNPVL